VTYAVDPSDETQWAQTPDEFASAIVIDLEEHLLAAGHGIANAKRQPSGQLVHLTWPQHGER
jgi:hypothetical protein